jgi:CheY-like chemotaxis protein
MATVLVVDDREINRSLARTLLGYAGHTVLEACDGSEALDLVRSAHPDLVVTDVLMPVMDGYELVRELRADRRTAGIPVVFCTAHYLEDEIRPIAEACGVRHVLFPSADPHSLVSTVAQALDEPVATGEAGFEDELVRLTPSWYGWSINWRPMRSSWWRRLTSWSRRPASWWWPTRRCGRPTESVPSSCIASPMSYAPR